MHRFISALRFVRSKTNLVRPSGRKVAEGLSGCSFMETGKSLRSTAVCSSFRSDGGCTRFDQWKSPGLAAGAFLLRHSLRLRVSDAIVIIYGLRTIGLRPIPRSFVSVFGRALELGLGQAGDVPAQPGVVFQRLPRQRIVVVSNSEKAAEA